MSNHRSDAQASRITLEARPQPILLVVDAIQLRGWAESSCFRYPALLVAFWACFVGTAFGQTPAKIDFGRDVLPILRQNCFGCHGPSLQMNGFRLDRRSSVFKNGIRRVVPGSSENSFLYHRLIGTAYGLQMPPTGPLRPEQIATIKAWIDQGAEWPDALANEAAVPPPNPKALVMIEALRQGDRASFLKSVAKDPKLLNCRGPEGSTPFMYAVLYGDTALLEQLLKKGTNLNTRNDTGATALMWAAATNLEKTRVLLAHNAEVNVLSDDKRTPLMIAAGRPGGAATVKLLLDHGATVNPTKNPATESSPLIQAALAGDAELMRMLMDRGADVKSTGAAALVVAVTMHCGKCVDLLVKQGLDKYAYTSTLLQTAMFADASTIRLMLDHGADVNAMDPLGHTALMYAAVSDLLPVETVELLVEHRADVNAKSQHRQSGDTGLPILDIANFHGNTPVTGILIKAGAAGASHPVTLHKPQRADTIQAAIQRGLPLIQRADAQFTAKSGCISCHNNSLAAMAVGSARRSGFRVDEPVSARQVSTNVTYLEQHRQPLYQAFFAGQAGDGAALVDSFAPGVVAYVLVGLEAEGYKPDLNTDAVAMYLKSRQMPDGHWEGPSATDRPPLCSDRIGQTVLAMRGLQLYAPNVDKPEYEKSIRLAASWIERVEPKTNEDRIWRLLGLAWTAKNKDLTRKAMQNVLVQQRSDGGWSDLPSMESNAYVSGRALVALQAAGLDISNPAFQRGTQFLLNTQMPDGSWYVKTRALAFQPYFEGGFPYGADQFISAAGTSWAVMALTRASQSVTSGTESLARNETR
ncbi:MAG TPA: ankyrin repeat domain-containing protein [Bryobacteraceae bacterium]|jgi:ankyrin repeat protein